jgi:hypothetical protein
MNVPETRNTEAGWRQEEQAPPKDCVLGPPEDWVPETGGAGRGSGRRAGRRDGGTVELAGKTG